MIPSPRHARPRHNRKGESGSVIIYIFIAIAMFIALSFAVSTMIRGSEGGMKKELVTVATGEIVQFADTMRGSIQTMRVDGITLPALSFENDFVTGYDNSNCADDTCKLFATQGGGVKYTVPSTDWLDWRQEAQPLFGQWYFPSDVCVAGAGNGVAGCDSDGADNEDVVVILPFLKKEICVDINNRLSIDNPNGNPPQESGCSWSAPANKYQGAFADGEAIESTPDSDILNGRASGCFQAGVCGTLPANTYHFYQVLVTR